MTVAAITGGGQSIGRGIAYAFARTGYAVSIVDEDARAGREALENVRETGAEAMYMRADISDVRAAASQGGIYAVTHGRLAWAVITSA